MNYLTELSLYTDLYSHRHVTEKNPNVIPMITFATLGLTNGCHYPGNGRQQNRGKNLLNLAKIK